MIEDLALGIFRMVKEKLEIELDFAPETLPILDHFLASLREAGPDEKEVAVVAPCAGAYFGEVARRSLSGLEWALPEEVSDYRAWRIAGGAIAFNPVGMVLEAVYGEAIPEWNAHLEVPEAQRDVLRRSLESVGPIREDDYFRLSVRHEVLDQAVRVLSSG